MSIKKGIDTHYVSEIDKLFHAKDLPAGKPSPDRIREIAKARRIARLRDGQAVPASPPPDSLWEDF